MRHRVFVMGMTGIFAFGAAFAFAEDDPKALMVKVQKDLQQSQEGLRELKGNIEFRLKADAKDKAATASRTQLLEASRELSVFLEDAKEAAKLASELAKALPNPPHAAKSAEALAAAHWAIADTAELDAASLQTLAAYLNVTAARDKNAKDATEAAEAAQGAADLLAIAARHDAQAKAFAQIVATDPMSQLPLRQAQSLKLQADAHLAFLGVLLKKVPAATLQAEIPASEFCDFAAGDPHHASVLKVNYRVRRDVHHIEDGTPDGACDFKIKPKVRPKPNDRLTFEFVFTTQTNEELTIPIHSRIRVMPAADGTYAPSAADLKTLARDCILAIDEVIASPTTALGPIDVTVIVRDDNGEVEKLVGWLKIVPKLVNDR